MAYNFIVFTKKDVQEHFQTSKNTFKRLTTLKLCPYMENYMISDSQTH